jgi:hypothetical protein
VGNDQAQLSVWKEEEIREGAVYEGSETCHLISTPLSSNPMKWVSANWWARASGVQMRGRSYHDAPGMKADNEQQATSAAAPQKRHVSN